MPAASEIDFDVIVRRFRQPLASAAYHLCDDREAAQDIVQETLVDAYRGFANLRDPEKVGAWLYAILRRKAIAFRKARKPEEEMLDEIGAADDAAESLVRGIVVGQLAKLEDSDRDIVAGKYLLGLSYRELADSLGIKESAIRMRCLRAKERLRVALQNCGVGVHERGKAAGQGCRATRNAHQGDENGM
jgi:RNA polymerase sigma-70 factor, ECF subfamily